MSFKEKVKTIGFDILLDTADKLLLDRTYEKIKNNDFSFLYDSQEINNLFMVIRIIVINTRKEGSMNLEYLKNILKWAPFTIYTIEDEKYRKRLFRKLEEIVYITYDENMNASLKVNILLIKLITFLDS